MRMERERAIRFCEHTIYALVIIIFFVVCYAVLSHYHLEEYDVKTNNCLTQSSGMVEWCARHGVPAKLVYGHKEDANGTWYSQHAWVQLFGCIDYESTSLLPCLNSNEFIVDLYQTYDVHTGSWVTTNP